jgi:hypothetical protein
MMMNGLIASIRSVEYQYCLPLLNCFINNCVITLVIPVYFAYLLFVKSQGLDAININIVCLCLTALLIIA